VAGAGLATGLFPPQDRDWGLPLEVAGLSPKAAQKVAREATTQAYDPAARALNEDWGTHYDGTQIRRWAMKLGQKVADLRAAEVVAYEQGQRPRRPAQAPALLVIGLLAGNDTSSAKSEIMATVTLLVGYVIAALGFSTVYRATVLLSLWQLGMESLHLSGLSALDQVKSGGRASSPIGEGLADALNTGGY